MSKLNPVNLSLGMNFHQRLSTFSDHSVGVEYHNWVESSSKQNHCYFLLSRSNAFVSTNKKVVIGQTPFFEHQTDSNIIFWTVKGHEYVNLKILDLGTDIEQDRHEINMTNLKTHFLFKLDKCRIFWHKCTQINVTIVDNNTFNVKYEVSATKLQN